MKDQYVGDVNDYLKFGLLRRIQGIRQGPLYVCWMLTPDDPGPDGRKLGYLDRPAKYRGFDSELFDALKHLVDSDQRSVADVEASGLLPMASYSSELIPKKRDDRAHVMDLMLNARPEGSLIFFDPDNGLETKKPTNKHLLWSELEMLAGSHDPVVIYQRFNRGDGGMGVHFKSRLGDLEARLPHLKFFAILGPGVGFFVGAREAEHHDMRAAASGLGSDWPGNITVLPE